MTTTIDLRTLSYDELAELRVSAARDVLERIIPEGHITLIGQAYIEIDVAAQEPCQACGVGALTLAVIAPHVAGRCSVVPGVTLEAEFASMFLKMNRIDGPECRQALTQIFPLEQLGLIEATFMQGFIGEFADPRFEVEGRYYDADELLKDDELAHFRQLQEAVEFGKDYEYEDERLAPIMQNIIANKGTFIPS